MTSQEIADLCGVSRTTVSRVINNDPKVKDATRAKVLGVMEEHNFVPLESARRLAGIDSNIIGLFVMELDTNDSKTRITNSNYYSKLINLIVDQSNNNGFQVLVSIITNKDQLIIANNLFKSKTIFAGIIIGSQNDSLNVDNHIDTKQLLIVIDKQFDKTPRSHNHFHINLDNCSGSYMGTKHLIDNGLLPVAHITGDIKKLSGLMRLEGYKQALYDSGIPFNKELVLEGDFLEESGYTLTKELISKHKVRSIFVGNDEMAIGAYKAIKEASLAIPEDISIVGFDNINIGQYLTPTLTTIDAPFEQIAGEAIKAIVDYYKQGRRIQHVLNIKTSLIIRES